MRRSHSVEVRHRVDGGTDDFGNTVRSWSDWSVHVVYGWGAPTTEEPVYAGHDRELVEVLLLVPPEFPHVGHRDQVKLDGEVFEAIGSSQMFTANPFGWNPGGTVNLRRVVG